MTSNNASYLIFKDLEITSNNYIMIILNKEKLIEFLSDVNTLCDLSSIKNKIFILKNVITNHQKDKEGFINIEASEETISIRKDVIIS